jgi:transmembrane sensor
VIKQDFLNLLDKYLAEQASAEEKQLLLNIYKEQEAKYDLSAAELETLNSLENEQIQKFKDSLSLGATKETEKHEPIIIPFYRNPIWRVAASLFIILSIGALFWLKSDKVSDFNKSFPKLHSEGLVTYANRSGKITRINLPDGSYVDLGKDSEIGYARQFVASKREVYLIGEGFFQVTKNHTKPFIVYTDKLVAKVLGTSFLVKSGMNNTEASVLVKTGKVSVFRSNDFTEKDAKPDLTGGVVLTPNHIADLKNQTFERKISAHPDLLKNRDKSNFNFDNTPIITVFAQLQEAYGITILYDKQKLNSCSISVNMGKENFYQKLDVICHTLNLSYEVLDGDVNITGAGCAN